jgi:hypothetical protein
MINARGNYNALGIIYLRNAAAKPDLEREESRLDKAAADRSCEIRAAVDSALNRPRRVITEIASSSPARLRGADAPRRNGSGENSIVRASFVATFDCPRLLKIDHGRIPASTPLPIPA